MWTLKHGFFPPLHEKVVICCGACKEDLVKDQSKRQSAEWSDVRQAERMRESQTTSRETEEWLDNMKRRPHES